MIPATSLALLLLTGCSGLSIDPEAYALGQTGRVSTRMDSADSDTRGGGSFFPEVSAAEAAAVRARELAQEVEREQDTNLSMRELEAMDNHAQAEAKNVFTKQDKMDKVSDTMNQQFGTAIKDYTREQKHEEAIEHRALQSYKRKMRKYDMEDEAAWAEQQQALNAARQLDRNQQRTEVREERIAEKELRHIRKKVDADEAKEKIYHKRRGEMEAEASMRLWDKANELRQTAEVAAAEAPQPRAEVLQLLDITEDDLDKMTGTLANFSEGDETGSWFEERVRGIRFKSAAASARLLETVLHGVNELKNHQQDLTDPQLVFQIVKLLNETKSAVKLLQDESSQIEKRVEGWSRANPEKLSYTLSLALNGVTGNVEFRNHLFQVDLNQLQHANEAEACGLLSGVFTESMAPAYRSLGHMREKLDKMAKVVPSIVSEIPFASHIMTDRTHDLVNMAYAEHLAFQESATSILQVAAPIVAERLNCVFSGSTQATLGFLCTVLIAVPGWLAL